MDLLRLFRAGQKRELSGFKGQVFRYGIGATAVTLSLLMLWANYSGGIGFWVQILFLLTGSLIISFIQWTANPLCSTQRLPWYDIGLALVSFGNGFYLYWVSERLETRIRHVDPLTDWDIFCGVLLVLLTLELIRRTVGPVLAGLGILGIFCITLGHWVPGLFTARPIGWKRSLEHLVFTNETLFGAPLRVAATYAYIFVLFGSFFELAGSGRLFFELSGSISGRMSGGSAKASIISSGLFGMISGNSVADVLTTGSFTIPTMKRTGFPAKIAGAIESVASTGGNILPPVMGSAVFLMVEITGIRYVDILKVALVPALLYYLGVFMQVHYYSIKNDAGKVDPEEIPDLMPALLRGGHLFIPIVLFVYMITQGWTIIFSGIASMGSMVVVSWLRKHTRMGPLKILQALEEGALRIVPLIGAVAAAGFLYGGLIVTGATGQIVRVLLGLTGGDLLMMALMMMVVCIVLGMGMPGSAAYLVTAVLAAPALTEIGLSTMVSHLYVLYFSIFSSITPPIAVAVYAASALTETDPIEMSFHAMRFGVAAYVVPFMFIYNPWLMNPGDHFLYYLLASGAAALGMIAFSTALEGYLFRRLRLWERAVSLLLSFTLFFPAQAGNLFLYLS